MPLPVAPRRLVEGPARAARSALRFVGDAADRSVSALLDEGPVRSVSRQSIPPLRPSDRVGFVGRALVIAGSLLLGFVVFVVGVTHVTYVRDQQLLGDELRYSLANSTAPTGQQAADGQLLPIGAPLAILEAPTIGLRAVVIEGTTSAALQSGPGHRRDTVLPGQPGASVIFGRQSAFGGPFSALTGLAVGDRITTTTGLGSAEFEVTGIRIGSDALPDAPEAPGTLTLVTATGTPFLGSDVLRVDAALVSEPLAATARAFGYAALPLDEVALASDSRSMAEVALSSVLLLAAAVLIHVSRRRWGRWQSWVVGVPVIGASALLLYDGAAALLPNLL